MNTVIYSSATFKDEGNQEVVRAIVSEVKASNPTFQACDIRGKS